MEKPKESLKSKWINVYLPLIICCIIFLLSLTADLFLQEQQFWLQRSGSIITILGAWVAFHESRESIKLIDDCLFMNNELPYKWLSLVCIIVGTLLWGYGDLPFK